MAKIFGVSRATVHEALRVLEHSGLVATKLGAHGGTYVQKPAADQVVREVEVLIRTGGIGLRELSEIRELLEGQNAEWAALRITVSQLDELRGISEEMRRLASGGPRHTGDVEALDVKLHTVIAKAAHNELSAAIILGIVPAVREMIGLLPPGVERDAADQYEEIYAAIAAGKPRRARTAVAHHVDFFAKLLGYAHGGPDVPSPATRRCGRS